MAWDKINLNAEKGLLYASSPAVRSVIAWRFWNQYGYFPDRPNNGFNTYIVFDGAEFYIMTEMTLTSNQKNIIINFFDEENNYSFPNYSERLTISIEPANIKQDLENYFSGDPTMTVGFVAMHDKQHAIFSRQLTEQERTDIKNAIKNNYIYFEEP